MNLSFDRIKTESHQIHPGFFTFLKENLGLHTFVETGTLFGDTSAQAAKIFESVHTIELSEELYSKACRRFAGTNVQVHHGDSSAVLPRILDKIGNTPSLFWLDGHFSGPGTAQASSNTPILSEIAAIGAAGLSKWVVLIDDLRFFQPGNPQTEPSVSGYPSVKQLRESVGKISRDVAFAVFGDIAIAVYPGNEVAFSPLLGAMTESRLFDEPDTEAQRIVDIEETVGACAGLEYQAAVSLPDDYGAAEKYGCGAHYRIWRGLIHKHEGRYLDACKDFIAAVDLKFHWRSKWYLAGALEKMGKVDEARRIAKAVHDEAPDFAPAAILAGVDCRGSKGAPARGDISFRVDESGESNLVRQVIGQNAVVFDVGANVGKWSAMVLENCPDVKVHAFEPSEATFAALSKSLASGIAGGSVVVTNTGLGREEGVKKFFRYEQNSELNTFYRRIEVEKQLNLREPELTEVTLSTLDAYCARNNIHYINFLKIDTEGAELDVLVGGWNMLHAEAIDFVQFEYGGTFLDAGITLKEVFDFLSLFHYRFFKVQPSNFIHVEYSEALEDYRYANFVAVNQRLVDLLLNKRVSNIDILPFCVEYGIPLNGVIHVGAHEGEEIETYEKIGIKKKLFIEANPEAFGKLSRKLDGKKDVAAINCAVSDHEGTVTLRLTNMDQSSSILPLKDHAVFYPQIRECAQVSVRCSTLDTLLRETGLRSSDYNIISIDIQGAEILALSGASETLEHIDLIVTEVSYYELYESQPLAHDLDAFLHARGFSRVATLSGYHVSWGDALYIRRHTITMSTLGTNGRFANQIFQYAFLKTYALKYNLTVEIPWWPGSILFGHDDPKITRELPIIAQTALSSPDDPVLRAEPHRADIDLCGYFQCQTSYYAPWKWYIRKLFTPVAQIKVKLDNAAASLRTGGREIAGIHLRRGDYGYSYYFATPAQWYLQWLESIWATLDNPVLFIATDDPEAARMEFKDYRPVLSGDLDIDIPAAPFYPDFYLLSQCDHVAIANSSFSFAACMMNERGRTFMRPDLKAGTLVPFDPWNSEPLLRTMTVEEVPADQRHKFIPLNEPARKSGGEKEAIEPGNKQLGTECAVLVCSTGSPEGFRQKIISSNEIFCGPDCESRGNEKGITGVKTLEGTWDLRLTATSLPESWKPDILFVKIDGTGRSLPVNLHRYRAIKVAAIGNICRGSLRLILDYLAHERFDKIVFTGLRHHARYVIEAGHKNCYWLPGFDINPAIRPANSAASGILVVKPPESSSQWFRRITTALRTFGDKVRVVDISELPSCAPGIVNVYCSSNGELSSMPFAMLSWPGMLLAEYQSDGIGMVCTPGEHFDSFDSETELVGKLARYCGSPDTAAAIAKNGAEIYKNEFTPERNVSRLFEIISGKISRPFTFEETGAKPALGSGIDQRQRIALLEFFQETQFFREVTVLLSAKASTLLENDFSVLRRIKVRSTGKDSAGEPVPGETKAQWDFSIVTQEEFASPGTAETIDTRSFKTLIIIGELSPETARELARIGLESMHAQLHVFGWKDTSAAGVPPVPSRLSEPPETFPDTFRFETVWKDDLTHLARVPFIVCALFTRNNPRLEACAVRLSASCADKRIPFCIYATDTIHRSISPAGSSDLSFTKPSFISFNIDKWKGRAVLYLDIDVLFCERPSLLFDICGAENDFAVYNWLADPHNEAYVPLSGSLDPADSRSNYYKYSHHVNVFSTDQLVSSGPVQLYKDTPGVRALLVAWQRTIARFEKERDDHCLDMAFNHLDQLAPVTALKPYWLPKAYVRFPWWPHEKPVILHPEFPTTWSSESVLGKVSGSLQRIHLDRCRQKPEDLYFPRNAIVDVAKGLVLTTNRGKIEQKDAGMNFWIHSEATDLPASPIIPSPG